MPACDSVSAWGSKVTELLGGKHAGRVRIVVKLRPKSSGVTGTVTDGFQVRLGCCTALVPCPHNQGIAAAQTHTVAPKTAADFTQLLKLQATASVTIAKLAASSEWCAPVLSTWRAVAHSLLSLTGAPAAQAAASSAKPAKTASGSGASRRAARRAAGKIADAAAVRRGLKRALRRERKGGNAAAGAGGSGSAPAKRRAAAE